MTLIGICIGIAAVVSLIMLGNGLRVAALSQFGITSTEIISVQAGGLSAYGAPGSAVVNPLQKDDADAIENIAGVEYAISRNIETLKIEFNDQLEIGFAVDIPSGEKRKLLYETSELETERGKLLDENERGKVILGHDFSDGEKNGFDKPIKVGDILDINGEGFQVKGIIKKQGGFTIDGVVMMDVDDLNKIAGNGENVDIISVKVKDKEIIDRVKEDIEDLMRKRRNVKEGEENFEVSTPQATLETVNEILLGIQIFVVLVALISIVVGGVGIVNVMTTSILERRKEIGIMKAIGAKNSDIFFQFFFEAGLLGLIGGGFGIIFGMLLGTLGTTSINNFIGSTVAPQFSIWLIIFSLFGSFLIGSISGVVPAIRAARQNPVEALRG